MLGNTGFGKTTLVRHLIPQSPRVIIVDPGREYADIAVEIQSVDDLAAYIEQTDGNFRIAYYSDELEDEFPTIALACYEMGNITLGVEEVQEVASPNLIDPVFAKFLKFGRHLDAHHIAVAQRPAETHRLVTAMAWGLYCFQIGEPRDLEYMRRTAGEMFADGLEDLPPFVCRYMDRKVVGQVLELAVTPTGVRVIGRAHRDREGILGGDREGAVESETGEGAAVSE